MATSAPPDTLRCRFCGRTPAVAATVRGHRGMIILMQWRYLRGPFCRDCGLQAVRRLTNQTLVQGWWGVFSLIFGTPFALISNWFTWRRIKALPEPVGAAPAPPPPPQPAQLPPPPPPPAAAPPPSA